MSIDRLYLVMMGAVIGAAIVLLFHGNSGTSWALVATALVMAAVEYKHKN